MRKIRLIGDVNDDMVVGFFSHLDKLLELDNKAPIGVDLVSPGGETNCALAIYGRMKSEKVTFNITAYGHVQSAAVLIYAAGDYRLAHANTWFMVHEESGVLDANSTKDLQRSAMQWSKEERLYNELMAEATGRSVAFWQELSERVTYFQATEALTYGLVNKILK